MNILALNLLFGKQLSTLKYIIFYFDCHWESYATNYRTNKFKMSVCHVCARSFAKKKNLHECLVCFKARNLSVIIKSLFLENLNDSPNMLHELSQNLSIIIAHLLWGYIWCRHTIYLYCIWRYLNHQKISFSWIYIHMSCI